MQIYRILILLMHSQNLVKLPYTNHLFIYIILPEQLKGTTVIVRTKIWLYGRTRRSENLKENSQTRFRQSPVSRSLVTITVMPRSCEKICLLMRLFIHRKIAVFIGQRLIWVKMLTLVK